MAMQKKKSGRHLSTRLQGVPVIFTTI